MRGDLRRLVAAIYARKVAKCSATYTSLEPRGYLLVRRHKCTDCHRYKSWGKSQYEAPDLDDLSAETIDEVQGVVEEPDSEDMPAFGDSTSIEDRLAIGAYVIRIIAEREAAEKAAKDKGK